MAYLYVGVGVGLGVLIREEFFDFLLFGFKLLGNATMKPQFSGPELSTSAPYTTAAAVAARKCHCHHARALGMIPCNLWRHAS